MSNLDPRFFDSADVLVVGDGDLSFSLALKALAKPRSLVPTVYDSESELFRKYPHVGETIRKLGPPGTVRFSTDARKLAGYPEITTANGPEKRVFHIVVFQMPLLPSMKLKAFQAGTGSNVLDNRRMLLEFFLQAEQLLAPGGVVLITSKQDTRYSYWRLHDKIHVHSRLGVGFLGRLRFHAADFPGYKMQNVDRDDKVRDTDAVTFLFGRVDRPLFSAFAEATVRRGADQPPDPETGCTACWKGPFRSEADRSGHFGGKMHRRFTRNEPGWEEIAKAVLAGEPSPHETPGETKLRQAPTRLSRVEKKYTSDLQTSHDPEGPIT